MKVNEKVNMLSDRYNCPENCLELHLGFIFLPFQFPSIWNLQLNCVLQTSNHQWCYIQLNIFILHWI